MVAKLMKSSPFWSLVIFAGLCLLATWSVMHAPAPVPVAAQGGGTTSWAGEIPDLATAEGLVGSNLPSTCANGGRGRLCAPVGDGSGGGIGGIGGGPGGGIGGGIGGGRGGCRGCTPSPPIFGSVPAGSTGSFLTTEGGGINRPGSQSSVLTYGNSIIDNRSMTYIHYAHDYPGGDGDSLRIVRTHRPRNITEHSSFGPGVFCNYDISLDLDIVGSNYYSGPACRIHAFDPNTLYRKMLRVDLEPDTDGVFYDTETHGIAKIVLYDATDTKIDDPVSDWGNIVTAVLTTWTGETFTFEAIAVEDYVNDDGILGAYQPFEGRLTSIRDRNGYGTTITYKTWTQQEIAAAPDRQWQIDTVTDRFGNTATFTYGASQVGGQWVVTEIALPNSETVEYTYASGKLSQVDHPDGTQSTFSESFDSTTQSTVITFADAAAEPGHQDKQVYVSNHNYSSQPGGLYNSASMMVRLVANGDGEVSYLNIPAGTAGTPPITYVYEGGGRIKKVDWTTNDSVIHYTDGWEFGTGGTIVDGSTETSFETFGFDSGGVWTDAPTYVSDERGVVVEHEYDANWMRTRTDYADGTFETWCYNGFNQVTRYRNRLGFVTRSTYDARGNLLTRAEGLKDSATNVDDVDPYTGISSYDRCATDDVQTAEYAVSEWEYYGPMDANPYLLKASIDANDNRTDYEYDANDRLVSITEPADEPLGLRPETTFTYDTAGRLDTVTDPEGDVTDYDYDGRSRVSKITYNDGTTERFFYGTGSQANRLVKQKDRRGVVTTYGYDDAGRLVQTTHAAAIMDLADNESAVSDPSVTLVETYAYLDGTNLRTSVVRGGDTTESVYDYRHRLVERIHHPNTSTELVTAYTYVDNQLFSIEDPYGRQTFRAYDATDGRLIRTIRGTVPSVTYASETAVLNATRDADGTPNATALITDSLFDAAGRTTAEIDPRGIETELEYDSRNRLTRQTRAEGTAVEAVTETDYDDQGNVVEVRHPRYFDSSDSNGYQKAKTTLAYTGRNRVKSRTEAPGTAEAATESFTYTLDGRPAVHTDFRGHDWETLWPSCCKRQQVKVDPLGHGEIRNTDAAGHVTHQIRVADVSTHTDLHNPDNAKTLGEVTTRYDERGRPVARTVWLVVRGLVDEDDPPIAGEGGISASDGLTTYWEYDDDLDDASGLDSTFSTHLTGLGLGTDADGAAALVTNPAGERMLQIADGQGRTVRTIQLASNDSALTQQTTTHDAVVAITGYRNVLQTTMTNLLNEAMKERSDGAGRTIETEDAAAHVSEFSYDANGNLLSFRDPNGVGEDCQFDALDRRIACTDTGNDTTETAYDREGHVIVETDAKDQDTTFVYDARNRRVATTDRISATTQWTWDANGNELSMTDAESQTTSYAYDLANRKTKTTWPDHVALTNPGDADYGITEMAYDALGRVLRTTDQLGDTITRLYDLAGRMTDREYRLRINSPSGTIADADAFTYDGANRILTAAKGRYNNTVAFTYDEAGRIETEELTVGGQSYTITRNYDGAGRLAEITYPDSTVVERTYTARGLLDDVLYETTTTVASFGYDDGGRETSRTFGNAKVTNTTYLTGEILVDTLSTSGVTSFDYAYDANDNKTAETIGGVMSDYGFTTGASGYDDENRLVAWERDDTNLDLAWTLSDVGDWDSFTENLSTQNRTHGNAHELTAIDSTPLAYDVKGNLTEDEEGLDYSWDFDNMLKEVTVPMGAGRGQEGTHSYAYDALGRRVSKSVEDVPTSTTTTTVFVNLTQPIAHSPYAGQVLAEYLSGTAAGNPERKYVYGTYIDEPLMLVDATGMSEVLYYYHANSQYSIAALTDASGNVVERYAYDPYGEVAIYAADGTTPRTASAIGNPHAFTARRLEPESGLCYFRARFYYAGLGRFASRDFIEYINGASLYYAYFAVNGLDPSGFDDSGSDDSGSDDSGSDDSGSDDEKKKKEHRKKRPSTRHKHTKPRPGRPTTKNRKHKSWKPRKGSCRISFVKYLFLLECETYCAGTYNQCIENAKDTLDFQLGGTQTQEDIDLAMRIYYFTLSECGIKYTACGLACLTPIDLPKP